MLNKSNPETHENQVNKFRDIAGKFLAFKLAKEQYGLEILKVQEIIGLIKVTPVPQTPEYVRGVINLRGKVIPVLDLRQKFGFEQIEDSERTCIIVMQVHRENELIIMGIIVDEVSEVLNIKAEQIEETPDFGFQVNTEYLLGIGKIDKKVVMLLNIEKILVKQDLKELSQLVN